MIYKDIKIDIPQDVKFILKTLELNGYEAYVVGGCVRDSLLNKKPKDWDITTSAKPQEIIDVFTNLFYDIIPTGLKHGTATVVLNKVGYEITTYRIDGKYEDGRHPNEVTFINDLKEDLSRRDFTINAMAYNPYVGLIDEFGGLNDIQNEIIRCVGSTKERFNEDALRMMRSFRFGSQLGFEVTDKIIEVVIEYNKLISKISKERISSELNKILLSDNLYGLWHILQSGLGDYIVPELVNGFKCNQNNLYHIYNVGMHIMKSVEEIKPILHLKLTMLFHDIGKSQCKTTDEQGIDHFYEHAELSSKMAVDILKRLKYDNDTMNKVSTLIKYHDREIPNKKAIRKLLNLIGEDLLRDLLLVKEADIKAQNPKYYEERHNRLIQIEMDLNEIIEQKQCFTTKDLAINGRDLIEMGFKEGKIIGSILNYLLSYVLEDPSLNNREDLIRIINEKNVI